MSASGQEAVGVEDPELDAIAELCAGEVSRMTEGQQSFIYMEGLHFLVKGEEKVLDALLCLNYPNPAYPTKLYLPLNLGLGLNWNDTRSIFGKTWFSWSWRDVTPDQPPINILACHLDAFR